MSRCQQKRMGLLRDPSGIEINGDTGRDSVQVQEDNTGGPTSAVGQSNDKQTTTSAIEGTNLTVVPLMSAQADNAAFEPPDRFVHPMPVTEADGLNKRQNDIEVQGPESKKTRIDIDLTDDIDHDSIVVAKAEPGVGRERRTLIKPERKRMEGLKLKLEGLHRRKRILELEEEAAEVKREMTEQEEQERTTKRIKHETAIKIED